MSSLDTLKTLNTLIINNTSYHYYSLPKAAENGLAELNRLPYSLKILLENLLRHEDGITVTLEDIHALNQWPHHKTSHREIAFRPARVLMQDFTGVPALVDLAAMRDAIQNMGGDPDKINPLSRVDLVIDHSVQVDYYGSATASEMNTQLEMSRNHERYKFLRWGQKAFQNFQVVPPDTGICHQVNLEYLAQTVWLQKDHSRHLVYPDTLVGTDSHTTMINGLGVLGWGVGGIEAEAAMLGQPISMLIPEVIGVDLTGQLQEGITATDLVLTITETLRKKGVVGKFVEFHGSGLKHLSLADRATIANMAPEYGATCGFFPIDQATLDYLELTGREAHAITLVEAYAKAQGLWYDENHPTPVFTDMLSIDLSSIEPSLAGPKRPQDKVSLAQMQKTFEQNFPNLATSTPSSDLQAGAVVIAAITSCTNTSNPNVLMAAGLLAKKAYEKGLKIKPWVKTSLAPGSKVVTRYLKETGLQDYLDRLGFSTVGYGCTTCIGNSGPLSDSITDQINQENLVVSAVLSGNRNFEGRVHPQVKANWLASPPLVVAFALAGTTRIDLTQSPIGYDDKNQPVYLKEIWPSQAEIARETAKITRSLFQEQYKSVFNGSEAWQSISFPNETTYHWNPDSTYIQHPPFFAAMKKTITPIQEIKQAHILALLGDSITTDHISPAGSIKPDSPAGKYLIEKGVSPKDFNSLGARRGNHEVMMRGTFANIRIKNEMIPGIEGGFTKHVPTQEIHSIYDAAMRYQTEKTPLVIIAGKEYGTGSSRDWAAKGPKLLGVQAIIAESFERIHRSNLIGMGILPLEFMDGITRKTLQLTGEEKIDILGLSNEIKPREHFIVRIHYHHHKPCEIKVLSRIDTLNEANYYRHGGILQYVLRSLIK